MCHYTTHPPYDHSISGPTDQLKRTNSNSSTRWIGVTHVWLVVGQVPIKAGWWNASFTLLDLAERIFTIFTFSNLATPTTRISYCLLHPEVFNPSNDFKFPHISTHSYEFRSRTDLSHPHTDSQAVAHKSWLARCLPGAPGF